MEQTCYVRLEIRGTGQILVPVTVSDEPWKGDLAVTGPEAVTPRRITDAALFSDGLSAEYLASVPERLKGCRMEHASLLYALLQGEETGPEAEDIAALLMGGN